MTEDLAFAGQNRVIERVKKLIQNDVKVNRVFSTFRVEIENNNHSADAAMMILVMLAADPVESENLIRIMKEPRDGSYEKSY